MTAIAASERGEQTAIGGPRAWQKEDTLPGELDAEVCVYYVDGKTQKKHIP